MMETEKTLSATEPEPVRRLDYIAAMPEIRAIASGRNPLRRPLDWRTAVELWEQVNGRDERDRAAFFVHIGIATTSECVLLDGMEDAV